YLWNWLETTHVLTLMVSLGLLFIIDLRMLGLAFANVPASKVNRQLAVPMTIGFVIMFVTGFVLYYANAIHETQRIWFRFKLVLLGAAGVNMLLFHRAMKAAEGSCDNERLVPKPLRIGAAISLIVWILVIMMGRLMAYDWYDCATPQGPFINWLINCDLY